MANSASTLEIISNWYEGFFADKVIEFITQYTAYKSNTTVSQHSPLSDFIYKLAQNTPKIGDIKDPSCFLFNYISDSINSVNKVPNVWQNMPTNAINNINIYIFKFIEFKFSTSIPNEMINTFRELYPFLDDFSFINGKDFYFDWKMKNYDSKDSFNIMLQKLNDKNCLYMPEGIDKNAYISKLSTQGEIMYQEYKVRVGYLNNLNTIESQQYFNDLIVKYRCTFIQTLENIPNPNINKSIILSKLHENNLLDFNDLRGYNWRDQTKIFLWSIQEKTANTDWFKCKETDFSVVSDTFKQIKNQELTDFSNNPTQDIFSTNRIGNSKYNRASPDNLLIGILYDDTLNSTNIKYINSVSKIK